MIVIKKSTTAVGSKIDASAANHEDTEINHGKKAPANNDVSSNPYPVSRLVDNFAWKTAVISGPYLRSNARNLSNKMTSKD